MQKEIRAVTITCDLCGLPTPEPWRGVSESFPSGVVSLSYDIWYGGVYDVKDICQHCQSKLTDFLLANKMFNHGQKRQ